MENEGFKINVDLLRGLPESKNSWPIWLGDHYSKGSLNIMGVVQILMQKTRRRNERKQKSYRNLRRI